MNKIAIYPGTFDPMTKGHIDIVKRSLKISSVKLDCIFLILFFFRKNFLIWSDVKSSGFIPRVRFLNKLQFIIFL